MLSLDLLGHVDGQLSSHLGDDDVAGVGIDAIFGMQLIVEVETIQTNAQEICGIGIISGLIVVGIPVGCQGGDGILPGVGCGSLGSLSDGCFGSRSVSGVRSVVAAGSQGQNHGQSQQQGQELLHFVSSF